MMSDGSDPTHSSSRVFSDLELETVLTVLVKPHGAKIFNDSVSRIQFQTFIFIVLVREVV